MAEKSPAQVSHTSDTSDSTPWYQPLLRIARLLKPGLPYIKVTLLGTLVIAAGINLHFVYTEDATGRRLEFKKTDEALEPGIFWACLLFALICVLVDAWVFYQLRKEELAQQQEVLHRVKRKKKR